MCEVNVFVNETGENPEFHLTNGKLSYIMALRERSAVPENLYVGQAIRHQEDFTFLKVRGQRHGAQLYDDDRNSSLEHQFLEYPVFGTTDFREEAMSLRYPAGDRITHLRYQNYTVMDQKPGLDGLPASFAEGDSGVKTLIIHLADDYSGLKVDLSYSIFENLPVICRSVKFTQTGEEQLYLERAMSLALDLPSHDFELLSSHGSWAREMQMERKPLIHGIQEISSRRGISSAMHNPFMALVRDTTTEHSGEVFGFNLLYSGNFSNRIEVDSYNRTRVLVGIHPDNFTWSLGQGESFQTPEAIMVYSQDGLNGMSQAFHDFYRDHLIRSPWKKKPRPVLINNWEGTYFDINENKIVEMAVVAKDMGIDLFVLDDGWFGHRDTDNSSLGDWVTDLRKLPNGIEGLADRIHELGLLFGLWFEPEMVSPGTRIWNDHPDWVIHVPNKPLSPSRHQYVLDMGRQEVVDDLFDQMAKVLEAAKVDYVKWDMNRYLTEVMSQALPAERQGETLHRFTLGVYQLYERLIQRFPDMLFESCASGGGRFDAGMLYYAPQAWTSDNSDAISRLKIQYGTSMAYPIQSMGAHVSAVPNHQTGRMTDLKLRTAMAGFGTFGYELDPRQLSEEEKQQIRMDIQAYKAMQGLVAYGDFYRLADPFTLDYGAWSLVAKDKKTAVAAVYTRHMEAVGPWPRIKLVGLKADCLYKVEGPAQSTITRYGDNLMSVGLILEGNDVDERFTAREYINDFQALVFQIKAVD